MAIKIIGVTGPSGAGKSFLSSVLAKNDLPVIDADSVYHSLLTKDSDCTRTLVGEFGTQILNQDGVPNTQKLGAIVFSSEEKLKKLNSLVLGFVIVKIKEIIADLEKQGRLAVIIDAPTLIESGFYRECDVVVSVLCTKEERIERIIERDGISHEKAIMRVSAQKDDDFYKINSNYVLFNNDDTENFEATVNELFDNILSS